MATRNYNIDLLRFVLILFVVQYHMNPYCGIGTPYFVFNVHLIVWMFMLISLYLLQARGAKFGHVRWLRLVLPYLSWSIIYLCLRNLKSAFQGDEISFDSWTLKTFLTGSAALHLYFIPLLLTYQLISCALHGLFLENAKRSTRIISCGILIIAFLFSSVLKLKSTVIGSEHGLFIDALFAAICAQILVSFCADVHTVHSKLLNVVMVLATSSMLCWQANFDGPVLVKVMIASGILYLILRMPIAGRLVQFDWLFSNSFGIFLIHHAIVELAEVILTQLGIQFFPYDFKERILGTFMVVVISCGLIHLIRRSKHLSLWLIGENKTYHKSE